MWLIGFRESPSKPWEFITWHSGKQSQAQDSADSIQKQEREVRGHLKAEARVFTEEQWRRKASGRKPKPKPKPKPREEEEEGGVFLGVRI